MLARNRALAERLNPSAGATWRVVRNQPLDPADEPWLADGWELRDGGALPPTAPARHDARSRHHALGLAAASTGIRTRWALFLDADCFIVRPRWMHDVLEHMERQGLAFFGVPYHPRQPSKLRYFPCAVCLFVDTAQADPAGFDWTPGDPPSAVRGADRVWAPVLRRLGAEDRLRFGTSRDTGYAVYTRHAHVAHEAVVPVLRPDDLRSYHRHPRQLALEKLLPDRLCVLPKRRGGFTDRGFAWHGLPDAATLGCEEYMWRDAPFALHLRGGSPELRRDPTDLIERLAPVKAAA